MLKVEGKEGIVRDEKTGAILSTDVVEFSKYINNRDRLKRERQEIDKLKEDVSEMKHILSSILNMLNKEKNG